MSSCLAVATGEHLVGDSGGARVRLQRACRMARLTRAVSSPSQAMVQGPSRARRRTSVLKRRSLPAVAAASVVLLPVGILASALARVRRRLDRQRRRNQELVIDCQQAEALSDDLQQRLDTAERAGAAALEVLARVVPRAPSRERNGLSLSEEDGAALLKAQRALEAVLRSDPQEAPSPVPLGKLASGQGVGRDGTAIKTGLRTYIYRSTSGVGAVNAFLQEVWPGATEFIQHSVEDVIQEAFSKLPPPLDKLGFERVEFGSRSLKLEDVQVRGGNMKGDAGHDVEIAARMRWNTDMDIDLGAKGLGRFGISHLDLDGRLVVYLKKQVPEPPFFEGCRAFFVDRPEIKFELRGRVLAMPVPALQFLLEQLVRREIAGQLVLPNMAVFPLVEPPKWDGGLWYNVQRIVPDGLLFVRVLRASGLPASDWLTESDPYVMLSLGVAEWRSTVCNEGGSCPEWRDEEGLFWIHDVPEQTLRVEVFDADFAKHDDLLATASVRAGALVDAGPGERSVSLTRAPQFKKHSEPIELSMATRWLPLLPGGESGRGHEGAVPLLFIGVDSMEWTAFSKQPMQLAVQMGGQAMETKRVEPDAGGVVRWQEVLALRLPPAPERAPRITVSLRSGQREVGQAALEPPGEGAGAATPATLRLAGAPVGVVTEVRWFAEVELRPG